MAVNFTDEEGKTRTFSARYVVATCEIGQNAYQTMNAQTIPANFISAKQFDLSGINWDIFWDQFTEQVSGSAEDARIAPKELRPHQQNAFNDVLNGFETCERGKLIMACGTGKTFTSLRIAEGIVPDGGVMLYLVPSLSLLGQTLCAWSIDAKRTIRPVLVCSDTAINEQDARRKKALKNAEDHSDLSVSDLAQPASTDPDAIMKRWERLRAKKEGFTVVFSTYQSIQAVSDAQKKGFPEFDLIICDEAHRTTGAALAETDDVSAFMRVHNNANVAGKKRLYMTATPRVYGEKAQKSAKDQTDGAVVIASMDDESIYGPVFHMLKFGDAVNQGLLADYKVVILTVRESLANEYRKQITDETRTTYRKTYPKLKKADDDEIDEVILSDFAKVIGCWQGLAKQAGSIDAQGKTSFDFSADPAPMRRAVAFAQSINISKNIVTDLFRSVSEFVEELQNKKRAVDPSFSEPRLQMNLEHVDGTNTANERKKKLDWLAAEPEEETCRILTNVRCLSEGVDVPALDAVLFLSPRNSKVDIIQSVGRVMRNAPGKNFGYIILPIAIPEYADPETILNKNERFKVVWEVLQALRSHDERLKIEINKIRFNDMNSGDTYDPNDPSKGTVGTGSAPDSNAFSFPQNVIGEDDVEHVENDKRIIRQRRQTIQVILGNPPYSVGQGSANDNNQNQKYPILDARVANTYAAQTTATNKNSLYNSYIKAFRWASDRIGESGVIGFVTNGGWLDGNSQDGLRKCFANEFTNVYVFNLRGNAHLSDELRRKEADNVFKDGTRDPIAVTILVKNPRNTGKPCGIFYHDIGDYLKREDKLRIIREFRDISGISFQTITPNAEGDWLDQRSTEFESFIELGNKEGRFSHNIRTYLFERI
ncbi:MAG: DEAD/DEAH box helicase family protein [Thermoguttaceae bacterium]|nr:DEAD/DEAH box helicase family protein [Thermoguttaceae bacterium]